MRGECVELSVVQTPASHTGHPARPRAAPPQQGHRESVCGTRPAGQARTARGHATKAPPHITASHNPRLLLCGVLGRVRCSSTRELSVYSL